VFAQLHRENSPFRLSARLFATQKVLPPDERNQSAISGGIPRALFASSVRMPQLLLCLKIRTQVASYV
jgi:hypothetical protein